MSEEYGYKAVHRVFSSKPNEPKPHSYDDSAKPDTKLAKQIDEYAKNELPKGIYNHSMRVYFFGLAIMADQFPDWKLTKEIFFVTSLLHDLGATEKNMKATKMSFEFWGGLVTREELLKLGAPQEFADSVFESIARHQDLGEKGNLSLLSHLLQLSTILDNVGLHSELVHEDTIDAVNKAYPRGDWLNQFACHVGRECDQKPWSFTTTLGKKDFQDKIMGNKLMAPYETAKM